MSDSTNSQLSTHILLKLSPDVFFHPLWIYFFPKSAALASEIIKEFQPSIQRLIQRGDHRSAAQLLLACAVLQKRLGDPASALDTLQKVWNFGVSKKMPEVACWAAWGACSTCSEQGKFCQAAEYLEQLQEQIGDGVDWVLAAALEMIKKILLDKRSDQRDLEEILSWMRGWGEPFYIHTIYAPSDGPIKLNGADPVLGRALPRFSRAWWRALLHTIKKYLTGEQDLKADHLDETNVTNGSIDAGMRPSTIPGAILDMDDLLPMEIFHPDNQPAELQEPLEMGLPDSKGEKPLHVEDGVGLRLSIKFYCLGNFKVYQDEQWIYRWTSRKALSVLKYLVVYYPTPISKEVLMDSLWPDADAESARRNLHQAIYTLRHTLKEGNHDYSHVLFEEEHYLLNPEMQIWLDFEEFENQYQRGLEMERLQLFTEAIHAYVAAEHLYQGDFMGDTLYEDLPNARRQYFWEMYLSTAYRLSYCYLKLDQTRAAIALNQRVLERDKTQEPAHLNLLKCYISQGQRSLAIRQYQICVETLREELDLPPSAETRALYQKIIKM
jgi:DNA-binding SARP family transcriptional activator